MGSSGAMIAAGASLIGGAVGSIASQAVGMATGQQDKFSWRGVAAGALGAGFTSGIGGLMGNVGTAVQGAMGGTGTWGNVARIAGAQALGGAAANVLSGGSFSWRQVAAGAVGSVASAAATNAMFGTVQLPGGSGSILSDTATGFVGGIVSAHTRKAFGVGGVNEGRIALDAFGNAVANAMVRSAEDRLRMREAVEVEAQMSRDRMARRMNRPNSLLTFDPRIGRPYDTNGDSVHDASDASSINLGAINLSVGADGVSFEYFGLSMADFRRMPGLARAYGRGFVDGSVGALVGATRWAMSEYEALASGQYGDSDIAMGMAQFGAFALSELEVAAERGIGGTQTARFIADSGRTAEYFSENPEVLVYGLLDAASEWWESRKPEQRAYGIGQFTGGIALSVALERGVGLIGRVPSMLEALRFDLVERSPVVQRLEAMAVRRIEAAASHRAGGVAASEIQDLLFDNLRDFNRALNQAKPNTRYMFDGHALITDANAGLRGVEVPKPGARPVTSL